MGVCVENGYKKILLLSWDVIGPSIVYARDPIYLSWK